MAGDPRGRRSCARRQLAPRPTRAVNMAGTDRQAWGIGCDPAAAAFARIDDGASSTQAAAQMREHACRAPRLAACTGEHRRGAWPGCFRGTKRWRSRPVSRVLSWTVIPLGAPSPVRSSNLPGDTAGRGMVSLFGLAPGGVCRAGLLPGSRCALTAPFHPCRPSGEDVGGIFLLHFPSARAAQGLPGTVPCGARTFLGIHEG